MANPFDDLPVVRQPTGPEPISQYNDPRGALLTIGSAALAEPLSGLAGLFSLPFGVDRATKNIEAVRDFISIESPNQASANVVENVSGVAEGITKGVRRGVGELMSGSTAQMGGQRIDALPPEQQRQVSQRVTDEGIGPVLGDVAMETTGSPFLAATAEAGPTGLASLFALGRRPDVETPDVPTTPTVTTQGPVVSVGKPSLDAPVDVTPQSLKIVEDLKKGKSQKVIDEIVPDAEVVESAQRLGVDLNPEHYSTNVAFQDVARALKNQPGSKLQAREVAALDLLKTSADDLIEEIGGSLDRAAVSESVRSNITTTLDDFRLKEGPLYDQVKETIPVRVKVKTDDLKDYLDNKIADLGGDKSLLAKPQKDLLRVVSKAKGGTVTYGALDQVRKNIGAAYQRRGPYADLDSATLDEVYGVLSDTQNGIADAFGVGDIYAGARELTQKRKALEAASVDLFGRNLANSLVPKISQAATKLTKGDVSAFNKLMDALPENLRGEVAANVLAEVFAGGSRRGGQLGQGFVASFEALNRSPTALNLLFKHLPASARQRYNDIGRVLTGIVKANRKSLSNPSGSAGPIIQALNNTSAVRKIYEVGKKVIPAEAVGSGLGFPGAGTAGTIGAILAKGKTAPVVAADELLTSPAFTKAVQVAIDGDVTKANRIIEGSPQYKRWLKTADQNSASEIARLGFIAWLTEEQ